MAYTKRKMKIVKTTLYKKALKRAKISAEDENKALMELSQNPECGDLIPHSGGFRKMRISVEGRGKSRGARAIYYYVVKRGVIYLVMIYKKNQKINLTSEELKTLSRLSKEFENE